MRSAHVGRIVDIVVQACRGTDRNNPGAKFDSNCNVMMGNEAAFTKPDCQLDRRPSSADNLRWTGIRDGEIPLPTKAVHCGYGVATARLTIKIYDDGESPQKIMQSISEHCPNSYMIEGLAGKEKLRSCGGSYCCYKSSHEFCCRQGRIVKRRANSDERKRRSSAEYHVCDGRGGCFQLASERIEQLRAKMKSQAEGRQFLRDDFIAHEGFHFSESLGNDPSDPGPPYSFLWTAFEPDKSRPSLGA
nr:hypothetical protein CFP56_12986 [Quercus suber]